MGQLIFICGFIGFTLCALAGVTVAWMPPERINPAAKRRAFWAAQGWCAAGALASAALMSLAWWVALR